MTDVQETKAAVSQVERAISDRSRSLYRRAGWSGSSAGRRIDAFAKLVALRDDLQTNFADKVSPETIAATVEAVEKRTPAHVALVAYVNAKAKMTSTVPATVDDDDDGQDDFDDDDDD